MDKSTLTFSSWGKTYTVEYPNSDLSFSDFMEMVESVALSAGWAKETINEYLRGE